MNMTLIGVVGIATAVISMTVKVIGLPDQIRKNHKRGSTEGQSTIYWILGLSSYSLWTFYGLLKGDAVLIFGQGIGIITTGIIVWQVYYYKGKPK